MYSIRVSFANALEFGVKIHVSQSRGLAQGVASLFNGVRLHTTPFLPCIC